MDDGVRDRQLDLADFTIAIHAAALFQLIGAEIFRPVALQFPEPEFQGLWSVDAFRSVPLHRAKGSSVETARRSAILNSGFFRPLTVMDLS
jgi:hypothetical protein